MNSKKQTNQNNPDHHHVEGYDEAAAAWGWHGPEILFGLSYQYVNAGESLLDIGVGTGLVSLPFYKAGLQIHGMDISPKMLAECDKRNCFVSLVEHDLTKRPYPFDDNSINHAATAGVLNFFETLESPFAEVSRVVKRGGLFAFTVADQKEGESSKIVVEPGADDAHGGVTMYRHNQTSVIDLLQKNGMKAVKSVKFTVYMNLAKTLSFDCLAYIAVKK